MSGSEFPPETDAAGPEQPQRAANPMLNALLGAIGGGGGFDPASLLVSQLGAQAPNDPRMALLSQLLAARRPGPEIEGKAEEVDPAIEEEAARRRAELRREQAQRVRKLRRLAQQMYVELETLRERNDTLAAALGACHLCFGTDPACSECGGRGVPGGSEPDPDAFSDFIVPAVNRVRWQRREQARRLARYCDPRLAAAEGGIPGWPFGRPAASEERRQTA